MTARIHQQRPRLHPVVITTVAVLGLLGLGGFVLSSLYVGWINQAMTVAQRTDRLPDYPGRPLATNHAQAGLNVVMVGLDDKQALDLVVIAHVSAQRDRLQLVTIPRNLVVLGSESPTLAQAYAEGGVAETVRQLEGLFALRMDHLVVLDLPGLLALADVVGGVPIREGVATRTVSGAEAAAYVEGAEDASARGELSRLSRHTDVIMSILNRLRDSQVLANPSALSGVVSVLRDCVTLDGAVSIADVRALAMELRLTRVESIEIPVRGSATSEEGEVLISDPDRLGRLAAALASDTVDAANFDWAHQTPTPLPRVEAGEAGTGR